MIHPNATVALIIDALRSRRRPIDPSLVGLSIYRSIKPPNVSICLPVYSVYLLGTVRATLSPRTIRVHRAPSAVVQSFSFRIVGFIRSPLGSVYAVSRPSSAALLPHDIKSATVEPGRMQRQSYRPAPRAGS